MKIPEIHLERWPGDASEEGRLFKVVRKRQSQRLAHVIRRQKLRSMAVTRKFKGKKKRKSKAWNKNMSVEWEKREKRLNWSKHPGDRIRRKNKITYGIPHGRNEQWMDCWLWLGQTQTFFFFPGSAGSVNGHREKLATLRSWFVFCEKEDTRY